NPSEFPVGSTVEEIRCASAELPLLSVVEVNPSIRFIAIVN
ncbi:MAG: hypothetical protein ACI83B_000838, partial [Sediminicola sp.]